MATVLLVDDNGNVLLTLAIALRRHGHSVTVSSDASQALGALQHERFDFLVSDVRMPGMSGIELAAQAAQLERAPRIVLTSAYSNLEARDGLAEAYLRKPIDVQQLNTLLSSSPPPQGGNDTPKPTQSEPKERRQPLQFGARSRRAFGT